MKNNFLRTMKSEKGVSTVVFVAAFGVIVMMMALVMDIGMIAFEKARLSSAMDASALAGAQELISGSGLTEDVVRQYANDNIDALSSLYVQINGSDKIVQVTGTKSVENYFSTVFGNSESTIKATAKAKVETIKSMTGVRPLAVVNQTFEYGQQYTLKEGAGDGTSGNYAAMAIGGDGADVYRDNLLSGYDGTLTAGVDIIPTQTGNIAGTTQTSIDQLINSCTHTPPCTYLSYNKNCPRILSIPIVNTLDINGKKYVQILGFGTFFVEGTANSGGQTDIIGRFITYMDNGETSSTTNDYGTYGIRLIK